MPAPLSTQSPGNIDIDNVGLATAAQQTTIIGHVDGVEGLLTSIDADIATLATRLGIETTLTGKTAQYTSQQTGVALWTPASGKKIVAVSYQIQVGGTTAGDVQLWFGASGDTTYTRGTDLAVFDGEFAPSATLKPGVVHTGWWKSSTNDHILRVTTSAAINPITVTVWGFEV